MANKKRFSISYNGRSVEISKSNSSTLVYRIPYQNIKNKEEPFPFEIKNSFVVYILFGKNDGGKDVIYVGKSKNGLKNRQTSHDDKYDRWTYCYILTQINERTFFNDGTIQYIEDKLSNRFNSLGSFINTTKNTNTGTANLNDEVDCNEYLDEVYQMLDVLGFDLITHSTIKEDKEALENLDVEENMDDNTCIPNGIYYLERKIKREKNKSFKATMKVSDGSFIVLAGSMICPSEGAGLSTSIINKRNEAHIEKDILKEDIVFNSPSYAAAFVVGSACNGWQCWTDKNNNYINSLKNKK